MCNMPRPSVLRLMSYFHFVFLLPAMAAADLREELNCSICLDLYTHPVMLPCGHNFCQGCIKEVLNSQGGSGGYSCPECRAEYQKRPALQRNWTLGNIAERFHSAEPGVTGIPCTYCIGATTPAVRSCLHCETSLCDVHLKIHNKTLDHTLIEPTASPEKKKCRAHKELLIYYCHQDASSLCASCCQTGLHKGHRVDPLNEALEKKKQTLRNLLQTLSAQRADTQNRIQVLQHHKGQAEAEANGEAERVTALFRGIREELEALEKRLLSDISRQKTQMLTQLTDLLQQLEIKKDEMSRKIRHIEELCNMADPLPVLQEPDGVALCGAEGADNDDTRVPAVGHLDGDLISVTLSRGLSDIVAGAKGRIYGQKPTDLSLDPNTAANNVFVSGDLKTATWSEVNLHHTPRAERFEHCQVLSVGHYTSGRHYWEVEASKSGIWRVGVAYAGIDREGDQSCIGDDKKSWCLYMFDGEYSAIHNSQEQQLHPPSPLQRIGIFLDYEAGRLSFYELSEPIRHLHSFSASFTEPLHAALRVYMNGWVSIRT
ncbi:hypothetical protein XENTR_v10023004 [Xenopus tropicalis]|uniref:E3 ubiquitin/ISG15 ligase TRIM25 n=2 Tax=Xenopus tropicalis TaxID=8364 RepID=F7CTL7_XENTR|nr:E3 ubiquitin/ISG15 ligase TRIM25 [Xenopus tropicalis]KAE8577650.1 hypothetical protein XENTR_v10023004 [Xenopus tropicalis]|eukprot:XP_002943039.2 PREDICTED: E3 ubiquitin/ISG15 ligase TRIM25-like [Xenopus tropicalis]